jgi:urease accessory protein
MLSSTVATYSSESVWSRGQRMTCMTFPAMACANGVAGYFRAAKDRAGRVAATFALIASAGSSAMAHTGSASADFTGGFTHPLFGPDHTVAMVAVGLWGASLGAPAIWLLPVVFPVVMACGGIMAILGVAVPGVEVAVALSAVVLGVMVALAARPPLVAAMALVGAFAIFHGAAHGAELPPGANAVGYCVGFVAATGLLHLTGIAFGLLARWPRGRMAVRAAGGAIALAGLVFLFQL